MEASKFALLIGVDTQIEYTTPRVDEYGSPLHFSALHGCNEDVAQMRAYLTDNVRVPETNITQLLSPKPPAEAAVSLADAFRWVCAAIKGVYYPTEERAGEYKAATYRNIVDSFHNITETAKTGDHVYIHYSGHGALATTVFPELKGVNAMDECLVPCDVFAGGNFIRDLEMVLMLHKMARKGLVVTIVLDCCFSGGIARQPGAHSVRQVSQKYRSQGPEDFPAMRDEILATFRPAEIRAGEIPQANNSQGLGFLSLKPRGYTLLAACCENEVANEHVDNNGNSVGLLTHSLLEALRKDRPEAVPADMLYRKIRAKVCSTRSNQVPLFIGDTSRFFFSSVNAPPMATITVQRVTTLPNMQTVTLDAGGMHGVCKEAEYSIFANTCRDFEPRNALVRAVVTEVNTYTSTATIVEGHHAAGLDYGCQAVLTSLPSKTRYSVGFMTYNPLAFERFRKAMNANRDNHYNLVNLNNGPDTNSDVLISENKELNIYELLDSTGHKMPILDALLIPVSRSDPRAESKVLRRIVHLAQYQIVQKLETPAQSDLKLTMEIYNVEVPKDMTKSVDISSDRRSDDGSSSSGSSSSGSSNGGSCSGSDNNSVCGSAVTDADDCNQPGLIHLDDLNCQAKEGSQLFLRLKNGTKYDLHVALFDLSPEFGITRIWPDDEESSCIPSGSEAIIEGGLTLFLEESLRSIGSDVAIINTLKAFATRRKASFPFDLNSIQNDGAARNGSADLQHFLDQFEIHDRGVKLNGGRNHEWQASELRIRTLPAA